MIYRRALRPILFSQDPEVAHERTLALLARFADLRLPGRPAVVTGGPLVSQIGGLKFPNPVGLAAGCDKNAQAIRLWPQFGFGFVEVGTITAEPQPGNPRPRLFRYPGQEALVNRLGFNSQGSEAVAQRLEAFQLDTRPLPIPLAINIGKTKIVDVENEDAVLQDYATSFRRLAHHADLMVINVSSPNTPGLRLLQEKAKLNTLLGMLKGEAQRVATPVSTRHSDGEKIESGDRREKREKVERSEPVPIFLKISPDMADADMVDVVEVALEQRIAGIIATNTTISRPDTAVNYESPGGLSGKPLRQRATDVMRLLYKATDGKLPLIGVGGIFNAEDAFERIKAGASLVQLYTAMIYEGPFLAATINAGLLKIFEREGIKNLSEIVGVEAK